jgi:hypothetical protein
MRFFCSLVDILGDDIALPLEGQGGQLHYNSRMVGNSYLIAPHRVAHHPAETSSNDATDLAVAFDPEFQSGFLPKLSLACHRIA